MDPLISVVIPTYNRAKTIKRCLDSILAQTFTDFEVIVVDDCSRDNTKEIVESYSDERVSYFCLKKNSGACVARNEGVKAAKGDYIAFQDSDDVWHEDKLEKQLEMLKKQNADIVFCSMNRVDEEKNERIDVFPDGIDSRFIEYKDLLPGNLMSTQTILGKKKCFENVRFDENMPRFQDWELALRLLKAYSVYFDSRVFVDTYLQSDSISKSQAKTVTGLSRILKDNITEYKKYPEVYYDLCSWLSKVMVICKINPSNVYKEMLKTEFNFKIFVKFLLCKIKVYK